MTIVKKHDSIQGGREGGIQLSRASATLLFFLCFSARQFKSASARSSLKALERAAGLFPAVRFFILTLISSI